MGHWFALLALASCGRIGFDAGAGDSGVRGDAAFTSRHWVNRNDSAPGKLFAPRLAYDDALGQVVLYGGDTTTIASAAMWRLAPTGWTVMCNPCSPGPRTGHGLAYDAPRGRLVLYGGLVGTAAGDLWEWDGTLWTQITPGGTVPASRSYSQLVYDAALAASVLIGGSTGAGGDDLVYHWDGTNWAHPIVVGGPNMIGGSGTEIAYDESASVVYVLGDNLCNGGPCTGSGRDDLWTWDGSSWTQVCPACTGQIQNSASIVHDQALDRMYMLPGYGRGDGTWQLTGGQWQIVDPQPPNRDSAGLAYDRARDVIVMYGGNGNNCSGNCDETWELVPN
jgi:hypothetical protein